MNENNIFEKVALCRDKEIAGDIFDLIPVAEDLLADIVRIRNQDINSKNMSLQTITLQDQYKWFQEYKERKDDLYWGVVNKAGKLEATIRLDAITVENAEIGSLAIDQTCEKKIQCFEFAVRAAAQIAFRDLEIGRLWASVPVDNSFMHKLDMRIGFKQKRKEIIRGNPYDILEISAEDFFWKTDLNYLLKNEQYDIISKIAPRDGLREKLDWISDMLFKWLRFRQEKINILKMLQNDGLSSIAIYGVAALGEQMIGEALDAGLKIEYVIDRNAKNYKGIVYFTPEDNLPEVEAIIITCMECDGVKNILKLKSSAKLIHISELMECNERMLSSNII